MSKKKFDIYKGLIVLIAFYWVFVVLLYIIVTNCLIDAIGSELETLCLVLFAVWSLMFIPMTVASILYLNVTSCHVWYDREKKELYRKGFIGGYKYKLKIDDIKDVFIFETFRPVTQYIVISANDNRNTQEGYYRFNKKNVKTVIMVLNTTNNQRILEEFWDRPLDFVKEKNPFA